MNGTFRVMASGTRLVEAITSTHVELRIYPEDPGTRHSADPNVLQALQEFVSQCERHAVRPHVTPVFGLPDGMSGQPFVVLGFRIPGSTARLLAERSNAALERLYLPAGTLGATLPWSDAASCWLVAGAHTVPLIPNRDLMVSGFRVGRLLILRQATPYTSYPVHPETGAHDAPVVIDRLTPRGMVYQEHGADDQTHRRLLTDYWRDLALVLTNHSQNEVYLRRVGNVTELEPCIWDVPLDTGPLWVSTDDLERHMVLSRGVSEGPGIYHWLQYGGWRIKLVTQIPSANQEYEFIGVVTSRRATADGQVELQCMNGTLQHVGSVTVTTDNTFKVGDVIQYRYASGQVERLDCILPWPSDEGVPSKPEKLLLAVVEQLHQVHIPTERLNTALVQILAVGEDERRKAREARSDAAVAAMRRVLDAAMNRVSQATYPDFVEPMQINAASTPINYPSYRTT